MTTIMGIKQTKGPEGLRCKLEELIRDFQFRIQSEDVRPQVLALIPIFRGLRDLGKSMVPLQYASAARDRILYYFRRYPRVAIKGDELLVISGIQEYARRVRELRVQMGWNIASGSMIKAMFDAGDAKILDELRIMKTSDYVMLNEEQDKEAAYRWHLANSIRKEPISVRDKILSFFLHNVGKPVSGEEMRYLAKDKTEWARRIRELRTEFGWSIATKSTGRPDLGIGMYVLESDRRSPEHDRKISDQIRGEVMSRDNYRCQGCGWNHDEWNPSDPRHLELHHIKPHADGGANTTENLITLCVICHDVIHRQQNQEEWVTLRNVDGSPNDKAK